MSETHRQSIEILLKKDDVLYKRIEAYAERNNMTVTAVVDMLVGVGIYHLMQERIEILESYE